MLQSPFKFYGLDFFLIYKQILHLWMVSYLKIIWENFHLKMAFEFTKIK